MRVVDLTQWYGPRTGGIRTYLHAKARWAEAAGLAPRRRGQRGRGGRGDGRRQPVRPGPGGDAVAALGLPRGAAARRGAARPRRAWSPSVVVLHDTLAHPRAVADWARRRGVAVAMVCHSDITLAAQGLPRPLRRPAAAALARAQRRGLAPAGRRAGRRPAPWRAASGRRPPARVVRSPLGVDLADFSGARADPAVRAALAPARGAPAALRRAAVQREARRPAAAHARRAGRPRTCSRWPARAPPSARCAAGPSGSGWPGGCGSSATSRTGPGWPA